MGMIGMMVVTGVNGNGADAGEGKRSFHTGNYQDSKLQNRCLFFAIIGPGNQGSAPGKSASKSGKYQVISLFQLFFPIP